MEEEWRAVGITKWEKESELWRNGKNGPHLKSCFCSRGGQSALMFHRFLKNGNRSELHGRNMTETTQSGRTGGRTNAGRDRRVDAIPEMADEHSRQESRMDGRMKRGGQLKIKEGYWNIIPTFLLEISLFCLIFLVYMIHSTKVNLKK